VPAPIAVRVGATSTDDLCRIGTHDLGVANGMPWQRGTPWTRGACRRVAPIRLNRVTRMTVTLGDPAAAIGARWDDAKATATLRATPIGLAPSRTWVLDLPTVSGRLILNVWYPRASSGAGDWAQRRRDYRLRIVRPPPRRQAVSPPDRGPPQPKPTPQTFDGSG
jgi:hypothetical protein